MRKLCPGTCWKHNPQLSCKGVQCNLYSCTQVYHSTIELYSSFEIAIKVPLCVFKEWQLHSQYRFQGLMGISKHFTGYFMARRCYSIILLRGYYCCQLGTSVMNNRVTSGCIKGSHPNNQCDCADREMHANSLSFKRSLTVTVANTCLYELAR